MPLKVSDVAILLEAFQKSDLEQMHVQFGDNELFLSRSATAASPIGEAPARPAEPGPAQPRPAEPSPAAAPAPEANDAPARDGWVAVEAQNLGTFYRAPSPDAAPCVEVGDRVEEDTEVCIIEVMKLFTAMPAGLSGTVREIAVDDGQMVEFGQVLMWIEPGA